MIAITKSDIDGIFKALSEESVSLEINAEAKAILKEAEKSEHFKQTVGAFGMSAMQCITVGGIVPRPLMMMCLVMFLLGYRHAQSTGAAVSDEPSIDQDLIDRMVREMDPDKE